MRLADIAATRPSVYAFVLKQTYSPEGACYELVKASNTRHPDECATSAAPVTLRPSWRTRVALAWDRDTRCVASTGVELQRLTCGRPDLPQRAGSERCRISVWSQNPPDASPVFLKK